VQPTECANPRVSVCICEQASGMGNGLQRLFTKALPLQHMHTHVHTTHICIHAHKHTRTHAHMHMHNHSLAALSCRWLELQELGLWERRQRECHPKHAQQQHRCPHQHPEH
jgi:hypothetical protein